MRKLYFISSLLLATTIHVFAQDRGISYQAVAIDEDAKEIPGYDIYGNPIPEAEISIRFGLYDETNTLEYEETHQTLTDHYGLFNLVIGNGISTNSGTHSIFADIIWSMDKKFLKVEMDVNGGSDYKLMSYQELLSVPFAKFAENSLNPGPTGVSVVIHPDNPFVPCSHFNIRYFETDNKSKKNWWFGGGFDLTPYFVYPEDIKSWHQSAKTVCDKYKKTFYKDFSKQCDEYFYNKHRNEKRGVGGLFFDNLNTQNKNFYKDFVLDTGITYLKSYENIIKKI